MSSNNTKIANESNILKDSSTLSIAGGIAAAIGASLCCAGPFILLSVGISGAWISHLTQLEPYRPYFIFIVAALFLTAGWQLFSPISHCQNGTACAAPQVRRRRQLIFISALIISLLFISSSSWIPWLFIR